MKKTWVVLLALGMAAFMLQGCGGCNNDDSSSGSSWLSVGIARNVDKQLGPVVNALSIDDDIDGDGLQTRVTATVDESALPQGNNVGTHLGGALAGTATVPVLTQIIQTLDETQHPADLPVAMMGQWVEPVPGDSYNDGIPLLAQGGAHSVDNNPCEQDSDKDGTPDVEEDRCDVLTDDNCTGVCNDGTSVKCTQGGTTFTLKFTDCVIDELTTTSTWTVTTSTPTTFTTWTYQTQFPYFDCTTTGITTITPYDTSSGSYLTWTSAWTDTTTSGWLTLLMLTTSATTVTPCAVAWDTTSPFSTSGYTLDELTLVDGFSTNTLILWTDTTYWYPQDSFNCTTTGTGFNAVTSTGMAPGTTWDWSSTYITTSGTWTSTLTNATAQYVNGSVALHYGVSNVDEQLYYRQYNNFLHIWDDDGGGQSVADYDDANDPYVKLNGQTLIYKVTNPWGNGTNGTTCAADGNDDCAQDGMGITKVRVEIDQDGNANDAPLGFNTGIYNSAKGFDWEDGGFVLSSGSNAVLVRGRTGNGGEWMSHGGAVYQGCALEICDFKIGMYDRQNQANNLCEDPQNTPCEVEVSVDFLNRTYDVTDSTCDSIDPTRVDAQKF